MKTILFEQGFKGWREAARVLLAHKIPPSDLEWQREGTSNSLLWGLEKFDWRTMPTIKTALNVSPRFLEMASAVSYHRDPEKWQLLYSLIYRMAYENPRLLDLRIDEQVSRFYAMEHQVRRDAHKAKAFVRFRKIENEDGEVYVAWHEPEHPILPYVAPFFQDRFSLMDWTILTPEESVRWNRKELIWGPGVAQENGPQSDKLEDLWGCYYKSIFNPARVKVKAMKAEMPKKYWHSMPETKLIEELLFESDARVDAMIKATPRTALDYVPESRDLQDLKAAMGMCEACDLCSKATQGVFGVGSPNSPLMLVGEQPGDMEDQLGVPFVGPAGEVLQEALNAAQIERETIYMTNSVKAFKFRREGKRRIHEKPTPKEVGTCKPWLMAEVSSVGPDIIVCLGLTAALAVLGQSVRLMDVKGKVLALGDKRKAIVTHHPAHILRIQDEAEKHAAMEDLVQSLRLAKTLSNNSQN